MVEQVFETCTGKNQFSGEVLPTLIYLGEFTWEPTSRIGPPRNKVLWKPWTLVQGEAIEKLAAKKHPRESKGNEAMFTGKTIEELINSVERAEQHAREQERQSSALPAYWMTRTEQPELIEVA